MDGRVHAGPNGSAGPALVELDAEPRVSRERTTDVSSFRYQNSAVYAVVSTVLALLALIFSLDFASRTSNAETKAALHDLIVQQAANEKVAAKDLELRNLKEALTAEKIDRIDKAQQLDRVYITSLQQKAR